KLVVSTAEPRSSCRGFFFCSALRWTALGDGLRMSKERRYQMQREEVLAIVQTVLRFVEKREKDPHPNEVWRDYQQNLRRSELQFQGTEEP
ncbi:MAG: hypothetical protein WBQ10_08000, partial [Terriglobales bacterium]